MTYHHANRLVAHWQPKDLTATAKLVALHLAQNLQAEGTYAGRYFHSGDLLSKELGLDIKTTYTALGSLVAAGLFEAETIHRGTRLRTYSLALDCPPDCQANNHYTALEIAGRVSTETEPIGKNALIDTPLIGKNAYTYRELTNKEDLDIDIETFTSFSFEKLDQIYLQVVSKALGTIENKTANHLLLDTALVVNPALVLVDARAVAAKAKNSPEAYLAKTTINSPESLLETFRAATSTEPAIDPRQYTEAEVSLIRSVALDVVGERQNEQKLYNDYLLASGAIPPELVDIVRAQMNDCYGQDRFTSLVGAVAGALSVKHSIRVDLKLDPSLSVVVHEGSFAPERHDFGADADSYEAALRLDRKRQEYQEAFDAKQAEIVETWLQVHTDQALEDALKLDQIEANEQARAANPELAVDREHYARLILTELHQLPAIETLADFLGGNENLNVASETLATEFMEFWHSYPTRPEGKGTKKAALKAWLETRKVIGHKQIMTELINTPTSGEFVKWPTSWLEALRSETLANRREPNWG
jgi:hypothetical protein